MATGCRQTNALIHRTCTTFLRSTFTVFLLLVSAAQQVIGSHVPIVAQTGSDVILPCHVDPAKDVSSTKPSWSKVNQSPALDLVPGPPSGSYEGRVSVVERGLSCGDASLNLTNVQPSDEGTYSCSIPSLGHTSTVQLLVGSAVNPILELNPASNVLWLECKSSGCVFKPKLQLLDQKGNEIPWDRPPENKESGGLYFLHASHNVTNKLGERYTCQLQQGNNSYRVQTSIFLGGKLMSNSGSEACPDPVGYKVAIGILAPLTFLIAIAFCIYERKCKNKRSKVTQQLEAELEPLRRERNDLVSRHKDCNVEHMQTMNVLNRVAELKRELEKQVLTLSQLSKYRQEATEQDGVFTVDTQLEKLRVLKRLMQEIQDEIPESMKRQIRGRDSHQVDGAGAASSEEASDAEDALSEANTDAWEPRGHNVSEQHTHAV